MSKFFLVLILYGGTTSSPTMTTIPEPFSSYDKCKAEGEDWKETFRGSRQYYCIEGENGSQ